MDPLSLVSPHDQKVTFVELFFDLVFVFSVTQVVGILHDGITLGVVAEAVLVFWLVWWAWTQFTWALNAANTDHPRIQFFTLLSTAVAFFMAVSVPMAFGENALWFALPYVVVRTIGLLVYYWVAQDAAHRRAVQVFGLASVGGLVAVIAGASVGGTAQYWLWGAAIGLDVIAAILGGSEESWNLHPEHFVERHGLIVIIALGESLIVAAAGLTGAPISGELIAVAILAVGLTCAVWWTYFPYVRPALEKALAAVEGARQSQMARDAFSLAHFPMLCGVVGMAVGIEEILLHPSDAMPIQGRLALGGGLFLFLLGSAASCWRALGAAPWPRVGLATLAVLSIVFLLGGVSPWIVLLVGVLGTCAVVVLESGSVPGGGEVVDLGLTVD